MTERLMPHMHVPMYRVVRVAWQDPLDTSHSLEGGRWNQPQSHEVLYLACSQIVARAIAWERLRRAGTEPHELSPGALPQLTKIDWDGEVVDVATPDGVAAAGFPAEYPRNVRHGQTQPRAAVWFAAGREGVVCRSATLDRTGQDNWPYPHEVWGELAVFVQNARRAPQLKQRVEGIGFLYGDV